MSSAVLDVRKIPQLLVAKYHSNLFSWREENGAVIFRPAEEDIAGPTPKAKSEEDIVCELAGSWKDDRSVEEMIADIYSSRTSNTRFLENLDD